MKRACITTLDAARARIFTYDGTGDGTVADGTMREAVDLINPGRRGHDLFSTTKPGSRHASGGTIGSDTDDHRGAHFEELERRFAKQVLEEIVRITHEHGLTGVIIVAASKMLGVLRSHDSGLRHAGLTVEYVERELAQLTSPQIHDHLAQQGLIGPRPRAAFAAR